jgi:hypothetical protein
MSYAGAPPSSSPSNRLLQAAVAGLLSASVVACTSHVSNAPPGPGKITSSQVVGELTADDFQTMCDARNGTVEVMAHCGGLASAPGFSYDIETQTLSEHSCKGANTCAGWNCITDTKA